MTRTIRARSLPTAGSMLIHALLLGMLLLLGASRARVDPANCNARPLAAASIHGVEDIGNESFFEAVPETAEEVQAHEVTARDPIVADAPPDAHAETDAEMPFESVSGASDGLSAATLEGPRSNNLIGTGGGAGGAFKGRGGMRSRSVAGGGSGGTRTTASGGMATPSERREPEEKELRRSTLAAHTARLRVGEDDHLPLESARASVRVEGFRARVTLDWVFVNDRDRTLEGTFQVRLPDGASPAVLGFGPALAQASPGPAAPLTAATLRAGTPTSGRGDEGLRFARFAPHERAERAYRETARERLRPKDPALLEWAASGVFDTRVYPLTARSRQRVVFAYDVALQPEGSDLVLQLDFPLGHPEPEVTVVATGMLPRVTPTPDAEGRVRFGTLGERRLVVRAPLHSAPVLVGEDVAAGPVFAGVVRPDAPKSAASVSPRAVFLLDVSGSARAPRFAAQLDLLEEILQRNCAHLREFRVAFFHVETTWWRPHFVANTPANVQALHAEASALLVAGATDLGAALDEAGRVEGDFDLFLLGDGTATWGDRDADALADRVPRGHPLFAYALGGAGNDRALLERLVRPTGGGVFAVAGPHAVAAAATAHAARPWRLVAASVEGAHEILLAGRPEMLFPGTTLTVVGRGSPKPGAALVLELERDGVRDRVVTPLGPTLASDLALGAYGRVAVEHLEEGGATLSDLARAYALHLGIVSASVSLVMLDTDDAYARYGIDAQANALAIRTSEPGRLAARARDARKIPDPRAAFERWRFGADGRDPSVTGDGAAFARLLALLPADALRPSHSASPAKRPAREVAPHIRALLGVEEPGVGRLFEAARSQHDRGDPTGALRTLSAIVEANPGDDALLRAVAFQALAWGQARAAAALLMRVVERTDQPHDALVLLGAAWSEAGQPELAMLAYEAVLVRPVALGRPPDARPIALADYGLLLRGIVAGPAPTDLRLFAAERLQALGSAFPPAADLVVTIAWNTDATDVDLHVTDPAGEACRWDHPSTLAGGKLSRDVRGGFGPERFVQERARAGTFGVSVKYYASDRRRTSLHSFVLATICEDWARPTQRTRRVVLALTSDQQRLEVAQVKRDE